MSVINFTPVLPNERLHIQVEPRLVGPVLPRGQLPDIHPVYKLMEDRDFRKEFFEENYSHLHFYHFATQRLSVEERDIMRTYYYASLMAILDNMEVNMYSRGNYNTAREFQNKVMDLIAKSLIQDFMPTLQSYKVYKEHHTTGRIYLEEINLPKRTLQKDDHGWYHLHVRFTTDAENPVMYYEAVEFKNGEPKHTQPIQEVIAWLEEYEVKNSTVDAFVNQPYRQRLPSPELPFGDDENLENNESDRTIVLSDSDSDSDDDAKDKLGQSKENEDEIIEISDDDT